MSEAERKQPYDVLVIGGGINGCGIARDAAGRGYSVLLAEMEDLASGTSSAATKLVHGGLRYLEHYEFRLVHESLAEREVLWASAPHIIWPLRFVLPHHQGLRPAWLLRLGLLAYDTLGGRRLLPPTRTLDLRTDPAGEPLKPGYHTGFEYSDCWVDDARMVALCARDAAARGANIRTRTKVVAAQREGGLWTVDLEDAADGRQQVQARLLVNAAGPWVDRVINEAVGQIENRNVRLVKGSHIVVRRLFQHDRCYIFQNADNRIVFAIPYENDFTLIGTTDEDYAGEPGEARISADETAYLCAAVSEYLRQPVSEGDVVWSYSGVRPLYDDGASAAQEATRDYVIRAEGETGEPMLVNIFGGKLTTFRRLSEEVVDRIGARLGEKGKRWTRRAQLPGGDFAPTAFEVEVAGLCASYPALDPALLRRLCRQYGTDARRLLGAAREHADLGEDFGAGLYAAELDYLVENEWARRAEDVLWRRTKLGLRVDADAAERIDAYLATRL
ncbi:MAG TPA: glycerol-3-phosphate dehydrogenase [Devosiaceae bacterium]|jgi:glycerol-3-phosphate dehydrogenase|nr:glycerol-3-phosphate dehydrogenase [Devosiaceae bacterium]